MADNGRYSGGKAGKEHRYSRPANDTDKLSEAKAGAYVKSPQHGEMPQVVPQSKVNTMDGPRGAIAGKALPKDRGGFK